MYEGPYTSWIWELKRWGARDSDLPVEELWKAIRPLPL